MSGRIENEMRFRNNIQVLLKDMPVYVNDFYYNVQVSLAPRTCLEYIRRIKSLMDFANTDDVTKITDVVISRYFSEILYIKNRNGRIVKSTEAYRKSIWSALNHFYTYLYKRGIVDKNPMSLIERPKKKDLKERRYLSFEDLNLILNVAKPIQNLKHDTLTNQWKARDYLILYLFMVTGIRRTALSEIDIQDISFINNQLTVIDKRNTIQIYDITPELKDFIMSWLHTREKLLDGIQCDALFISKQRRRMCSDSVAKIVYKYSKLALGQAFSPHKLRAAFVTLYYEASGHDIEATRRAVGHADISTTSIYITTENNDREKAAKYMSKNLIKRN